MKEKKCAIYIHSRVTDSMSVSECRVPLEVTRQWDLVWAYEVKPHSVPEVFLFDMFIFILFYANQNCWNRFWAPAHMVCERGFLEASWKRRWRCLWRVDAGWPTTPSTMLQRRLRTSAPATGRPVDCVRLSRLGRTCAVVRPRSSWIGARHLGRAFAVVRPWWRLLWLQSRDNFRSDVRS